MTTTLKFQINDLPICIVFFFKKTVFSLLTLYNIIIRFPEYTFFPFEVKKVMVINFVMAKFICRIISFFIKECKMLCVSCAKISSM